MVLFFCAFFFVCVQIKTCSPSPQNEETHSKLALHRSLRDSDQVGKRGHHRNNEKSRLTLQNRLPQKGLGEGTADGSERGLSTHWNRKLKPLASALSLPLGVSFVDPRAYKCPGSHKFCQAVFHSCPQCFLLSKGLFACSERQTRVLTWKNSPWAVGWWVPWPDFLFTLPTLVACTLTPMAPI